MLHYAGTITTLALTSPLSSLSLMWNMVNFFLPNHNIINSFIAILSNDDYIYQSESLETLSSPIQEPNIISPTSSTQRCQLQTVNYSAHLVRLCWMMLGNICQSKLFIHTTFPSMLYCSMDHDMELFQRASSILSNTMDQHVGPSTQVFNQGSAVFSHWGNVTVYKTVNW